VNVVGEALGTAPAFDLEMRAVLALEAQSEALLIGGELRVDSSVHGAFVLQGKGCAGTPRSK
jgi:hypothetical protein